MSFWDEVEAAREAIAVAAEEEARRAAFISDERRLFESELRALWRSVDEYWRSHVGTIDAGIAEYFVNGKSGGLTGEKVPRPFPNISVFEEFRSEQQWRDGEILASRNAQGVNVGGWFAFGSPGELFELDGKAPIDVGAYMSRRSEALRDFADAQKRANQRSYRRLCNDEAAALTSPGFESGYAVIFAGPEELPRIMLHREPDDVINVYRETEGIWRRGGTLSEHVARAVALLDFKNS